MSYRCQVCTRRVPPGTKRRLHVVHRMMGKCRQIELEVPVCQDCEHDLTTTSLDQLREQYRRFPLIEPPSPKRSHVPSPVQAGKRQPQETMPVHVARSSRPVPVPQPFSGIVLADYRAPLDFGQAAEESLPDVPAAVPAKPKRKKPTSPRTAK